MTHPTPCPGIVFGPMACLCDTETHNARKGAEGSMICIDMRISELEEYFDEKLSRYDTKKLIRFYAYASNALPELIEAYKIAAASAKTASAIADVANARAEKAEAVCEVMVGVWVKSCAGCPVGHVMKCPDFMEDCKTKILEWAEHEAAKRGEMQNA